MKYILIDVKDGDYYTDEFMSADKAVEAGQAEWNSLSHHDKKHRTDFYVLKSDNPDEDAEDHLDGDFVKIWKLNGTERCV